MTGLGAFQMDNGWPRNVAMRISSHLSVFTVLMHTNCQSHRIVKRGEMSVFGQIQAWGGRLKRDAVALWFASRHARTPWLPRIVCVVAVAYALSPIDLIPDFVPVLGYIDDALLLPALLWLAVRLTPRDVMEACRAEADKWMREHHAKPGSRAGAIAIVGVWVLVTVLCLYWLAGTVLR